MPRRAAAPLEPDVPVKVRLTAGDVREIDRLIKAGFYRDRSDVVREGARLLLREHSSRMVGEAST